MEKQLCFLEVDQQWRPSLVFDSFNALLEAFAKVAGNNVSATLQADALDDLVARRSTGQPVDGKVSLVLGHHTKRVLWGDDAETETKDFFIYLTFLLKEYKDDEDWKEAISQATQLIRLDPNPQAPLSFGEKHLRFLKADDDAWQPALIFDSFAHLQEALQSVLTPDKIKGFEDTKLAAMDSIMKRAVDQKSIDGNIAITWGATEKNCFLWSDEISETRDYSRHLCAALQENQDLAASAVVTEAHKLFRIPAISFEIVNSFQAEVQPAPESPTTQHHNSESEEDTPTVIASVDGTLNEEGVDFGSSDSHVEEEEAVEPAPRKPARGKRQAKKPPIKKKLPKKSGKTVAKKTVAKKVKAAAAAAAQKKKKSKETTAVKSALKRTTTPATVKRGGKKVQIDPKFRPDDTRMSPYSKSDVSIQDDEKYRIPTSQEVLPILKKLGYKTAGSNYFRPGKNPKERKEMVEGTDYFASISELRRFLCMRGVEMMGFEIKDGDARKEKKMSILQKWIRYSISPGLRNLTNLPKETRSPLESIYKPLVQLGFKYSSGFYFLPGVKPKRIGGICTNGFPLDGEGGMWAKLCRYGLPGTCDFSRVSNTDRIRLELYLSDCQFVETFDFLKQVDEQFLESMKKKPSTGETGSEVVFTTTPRPFASTTITPTATTGPSSAVGASSNCERSTTGDSIGATIVTNATGDSSEQGDTMKESGDSSDKQAVESYVSNPVESAEKCTESAMRQLTRPVGGGGSNNNLSPQPAKELFKTTPPDVAEKKRKQQESSSLVTGSGEAQSSLQTAGAASSSTDEPLRSGTTPSQQTASQIASPLRESDSINNRISGSVEKQADLPSSQMESKLDDSVDATTASPTDGADKAQDTVQPDRLGSATTVDEGSVTDEPLQSPTDLVPQSESPAEGNAAPAHSPRKCIVETAPENPSPDISKFVTELEEEPAGVIDDLFGPQDSSFDCAPLLTQDAAISEFPSTPDEDQTQSVNTSDSLLEPGTDDSEIDKSQPDRGAFDSSNTESDLIAPPQPQETADEAAPESDSKPIAKESSTSSPSPSTGEVTSSRDETAFEMFMASLVEKVKPDDSWDAVLKKMRLSKMTWRKGTGLAGYDYVFPGRLPRSKGGILGYDFVDDVFGLKEIAFERCGWKGDDAFLAEQARRQTTHTSRGRSSPRQRSSSEVGKSEPQRASMQRSLDVESNKTEVLGLQSGAKRSPSKKAIAPVAKRQKEASENSNQASENAYEEWIEALKQIVSPTDHWVVVEKKIKHGMTYSSGGLLAAWDYTFPGKKSRSEGGVLGTDYVNDVYALKVFAIDHLGWLGDPKFLTEKAERESHGSRRRKRSFHASPEKKGAGAGEVQVSKKTQRRKQPKVEENLRCCQRDLQRTKQFKRLAIINNDKPSKFKDQVSRVQSFLLNALSTNGESSDSDGETAKPILYVCGAPGVGKTSAVKWCCEQAKKSVVKGDVEGVSDIRFAFVNATSTGDVKGALKEIKDALDIPGQQMTVSSFKNYLKKKKDSVVLVIDEVDHMVSTRPNDATNKTTKEKLLHELCTIASNPEHAFVLVGVSNAVGASEVKKLKSIGMGDEKVPFAPYSKDDLIELVTARVGLTTIDEKALMFLASKVSSGSGDARMMLELVSSAVEKCKKSLTVAQLDATMEQPVVTIRHAMQAVKASAGKVAERIESLPETQKLVLCVAVTACRALPGANFRMAELRDYINAVLKEDGELDTMDNDDFITTIQNLVDQGLLLPSDDGHTDIRAEGLGAFRETQVRFGHQLEDVESIVDQRLSEKPVYGRLMEAIRKRPPR